MLKCVPMVDIMIVGAQKAGTTSLKNYLNQHPQIISHDQIEMTFFFNESEYSSGENFLKNHYRLLPNKERQIVAKHATLTRSEDAIKRLKEHNPDCKIIFLMRDPVSRTFSSYLMSKRNGTASEDFQQVLKIAFADHSHWYWRVFVKLSCYIEHLDLLKKYFPTENIIALRLEDLQSNPKSFMNDLCDRIGIEMFVFNYAVHNNASEPIIHPARIIVDKVPMLKSLMLKTLGYQKAIRLSQYYTRYFTSENLVVENLIDYGDFAELEKLKQYFSEYNLELSSKWGIVYN